MVALLDTVESSERERMEGERQQRISRYKEQRRRQLAAQYGAHDVGGGGAASGGGVSVRSTRASRLRSAAAATVAANGSSSDSPGNKSVETVRRPSTGERKEVNGRLGPRPQDTKEKSPLPSDHSSSSGAPRRERDKSAKRKSNLNRSLNAEPVHEDGSRRRRSLVLSGQSPRSPPVTAAPAAPASAPETESPRHVPGRGYKRTTPPRDSPRHRPRSSSATLESVPSAIAPPSDPPPPVNGQLQRHPSPEPPPVAPAPTPAPPLPDVVVLPSAPAPAAAKPSSILKKKSLDETATPTVVVTGKPVSILKRKTSQEEGPSTISQPVTFSPSVIEPSSSRRQGILKKHRSLDDGGGVMVRRSVSPDKPILKHQRRSSLEEVRRRTQSPEPTSILKRKTSRDEAVDSSSTSEPQGILKRKTSGSSTPVHVTIADSVILALAGEDSLTEDHVRPILKKKMSVGEEPCQTQDSPVTVTSETPKPILKKKSSSETEETEDKPKKPILKSRSSSRVSEGRSSFTGLETPMNGITNGAEAEPSALSVRSESSPERSVIRRVGRNDSDTTAKRRSLDSWVRFREDCERANDQSTRVRASWSVAERVLNMESFLANEAAQRPRSLSPGAEGKGAVPKRTRDGERWRTQPITVQELSDSRSWSREQPEMPRGERETEKDSDMRASEREDPEREEGEDGRKLARSNSVSARASMFEALRQQEETQAKKVPKGSAARRVKLDPSRFQTQPVTQDEVEEAKRANEASKSSSAEDDDPNDPSKLSLAERVKLFNEKMVTSRFNARTQRHKTQPVTPEEVETAQKLTPMARSASSVLVSGILKNLSEKNLGPKPKASSDSDEDLVNEPSSPLKRGILKSPSRNPKPLEIVEDSDSSCLKSVLKKENKISEPDRKSKDLHSILKVSKDKETSSSEETESESEDDKPNANSDLIDLLHKVEAQARGERKANTSPERRKSLIISNNKKPDESDKLMNLKNLDQGKENYDVTRRVRRKKESGDLSGEDSSSSGGREVRKIIGNEAIARRRQAGLAREAAERAKRTSVGESLSKSRSHSAMNGEVVLRPPSGAMEGVPLRRCRTQPMDECDEPLTNGVSIAQRLEALQKRGQTDWKKRISRLNPGEELPATISINAAAQVLVERVVSPPPPAAPPPVATSLPHTLSLLQEASEGWRRRVSPSDATKFSVAGKMGGQTVPVSPLLSPNTERKKVKPERFRSKGPAPKDVQSVPTSPDAELSLPPTPAAFKRSVSAPGEEDKSLSSGDSEGPLVTVPKAFDEDFSNFFASSSVVTSERLELRDEDLETVTSSSNQLLVHRKQVKVQRRRVASSNPVKALAARTDLRDTYVEVKTGVASREEQRLRIEKLAKNSSLAVEALAGLASKEDFAGVQLRSTAQTTASVHTGPWLPYADLMLLQVKGRRHVQTRLVRPHYTSINRGDSYVLVTPSQVFQWLGEFSNVIERSRSGEIASHIAQTRDLGCSAANVTVVQGGQPNKQFWQLLGADEDTATTYRGAEAGHPDEDELYELAVTDTNKIYELEGDELVPREDCWANIPRIEILSHNKVLVFDFGAELYVWLGKSVSLDRRPTVLKLAQELWNHGFDYTECDICPITQAELLGTRTGGGKVEKRASKRPEWCLLAKVTQHMETVLFREKFLDWPDFSRVIQVKNRDKDKQVESPVELQPCDAQEMADWSPPEPDLQLEGSHLGRGDKYYDAETHRHFEISTLGVTVWHVREFDSVELEATSVGQFHSGDSYVVRWHYSVTVTGRELTGQPSRHSTMGRDRVAYWTWQGKDASINDSGAAALLTVQLDQERGPQLTIKQGNEPPAFRRLFNSGLLVHKGRRTDGDTRKDRWRLYIVLGEETAEAMLLEVPLHCRQLRSRGCLLLLDTQEGRVYVWRGGHALDHTHQVAQAAVERLKDQLPSEAGLEEVEELEVEDIREGKEPKLFFEALGGHNRQMYHSLLSAPAPSAGDAPTPRLFLMTGVSGALTACPAVPVCGHTRLPSPFPYTQETLYDARQPALYLVDAGACVWLWQGWVSEAQADAEVGVRWQSERRAAMATALRYHRLRRRDGGAPAPRLVWAGLEPLEFTNLFPTWECRDDVTEINISDGHAGELVPVEAELERLTQSTFPPSQLLQRPLPDGVDPTRLEDYLAPQHFQEVLGLTKEEFSELPAWKQNKLKQEKGLF